MEDLAALDVLIGLAFLFFVMATVVSAVNELIQTAVNQRSRTLKRGIRALLENDDEVERFFNEPRVRRLFDPRTERPPSYIPARTFALTVLDGATRDTDRFATDLYVKARETVEKIGLPPC